MSQHWMSILQRVNWGRARLLLSIVWIVGVVTVYFDAVTTGRADASQAKVARDRGVVTAAFEECLKQNGITWGEILRRYKSKCEDEQAQMVGADQTGTGLVFGPVNFVRDYCLRTRFEPCSKVGGIVQGDLSTPLWAGLSFEQDYSLKQWLFYLRSGFARPLFEAIALAFGFPLLLAVAPRFLRRLGSWLTTNP